MRKTPKFRGEIGPARRILRIAHIVSVRRPRSFRRESVFGRGNSIRRPLHRQRMLRSHLPIISAAGPSISRRQRIGTAIRRSIAVASLLIGIVLVMEYPAFLLPLLPVQALIVCELIFWSDRDARRESNEPTAQLDIRTKRHLTRTEAKI